MIRRIARRLMNMFNSPRSDGDSSYEDETCYPCIRPLKSLGELNSWKAVDDCCLLKVPLAKRHIPVQKASKLLVCHDMNGGYHEDRYIQGTCSLSKSPYRFYHWQYIDTFVYFSHCFITIPPTGWITAAHRNGVKILGTVITEWEDGALCCEELLQSEETIKLAVSQLTALTLHFGFDGWLINIENKIKKDQIPRLIEFVHLLTKSLHDISDGMEVIWYDSVIMSGELDWQNELNQKNKEFFDVCDGIFLNYTWKKNNLENSAKSAVNRLKDVYVGIDVYGRGCYGGGGFNTKLAVEKGLEMDLSIALFAPGWTYEVLGENDFLNNENKYWRLLSEYFVPKGPTELPFVTSFCQGYGTKRYYKSKVVYEDTWYNLNHQEYQPSITYGDTVDIYCVESYNGGTCLSLEGQSDCNGQSFTRLFSTHFDIESCKLDISYIYKDLDISSNTQHKLYLRVQVAQDQREDILVCAGNSDYCDITEAPMVEHSNSWVYKKCMVYFKKPTVIEEIGLYIETKPRKEFQILLGCLKIIPGDYCQKVVNITNLKSTRLPDDVLLLSWDTDGPIILYSHNKYIGLTYSNRFILDTCIVDSLCDKKGVVTFTVVPDTWLECPDHQKEITVHWK